MLRAFLDGILQEIGSESLTDDEYAALPSGLSETYTKAEYDALKGVLQEREGVSGQLKRLNAFFIAKGADLTEAGVNGGSSMIFVGAALD